MAETESHIIAVGMGSHFSPVTGALFTDKSKGAAGAKPTVPIPAENKFPQNKWVSWGSDNLFPQNLLDLLKKCVSANRALVTRIQAHYGKGLFTYKTTLDKDGNEKIVPFKDAGFEEFARRNNIKLFLTEHITNFEYFFNTFPEVILSKDRKKITNLYSNDAPHCRWGLMNEKTRRIEKCYVSAVWGSLPAAQYLDEIPVLDAYDPLMDLKTREDGHKFILPVYFPSPERSYYQAAPWHSVYESGWMEIATQVVEFKKALFKHSISIKYHIQIPTNYWTIKFKDEWENFTTEEREAKRKATYTSIENYLVGAANAGKSLQTTYYYDPDLGKEYPGVKIDVVDDKFKDGAYIPDTQQADSQVLFGIGVDPTVIGAVNPGDKSNAGSGSDKREALLLMNAWMQIYRDVTLAPLYLVRDYNGYDPEMMFGFRDMVLTTLDKNPKGIEKIAD